jgi:hypothetical protein
MHRTINSLIGHNLEAIDGEKGKVEDFYFDGRAWIIVYLIVRTRSWLSDRSVLISPATLIKGADRSQTFPVNLTRKQIRRSPEIKTKVPSGASRLRSTESITGYDVETPDGGRGHLVDFIIDDETWHIKYVVIEMHSWLERRRVVLALHHVKEVQWSFSNVLVDITSDRLKNGLGFRESDYSYSETENTLVN